MRILHINTSAEGGAAKAAQRIHTGLIKEGVESRILVLYNSEVAIPGLVYFQDQPTSLLSRILRSLRYRFFVSTSPFRKVSSPVSVFHVESHPLIKWADIICLHWVANFVNYPSFFAHKEVLKRPIVWRPPDLFPVRGVIHHDRDLTPEISILESKALEIKHRALSNHNNIKFVASSSWMYKEMEDSPLTNGSEIVLIHNALDIKRFAGDPIPLSDAKQALAWDDQKPVALFIAHNLSNPSKGLQMLLDGLRRQSLPPFTLTVVGNNFEEVDAYDLDVLFLGPVNDEDKLRQIYYAADVYVTSSLAEAFGQTVLEAISCGRPVVAFSVGGITDMVIHERNGLLAEGGDIEELLCNLERLLMEPTLRVEFAKASREHALDLFTQEVQVEKYRSLYSKILDS